MQMRGTRFRHRIAVILRRNWLIRMTIQELQCRLSLTLSNKSARHTTILHFHKGNTAHSKWFFLGRKQAINRLNHRRGRTVIGGQRIDFIDVFFGGQISINIGTTKRINSLLWVANHDQTQRVLVNLCGFINGRKNPILHRVCVLKFINQSNRIQMTNPLRQFTGFVLRQRHIKRG